MLTWSLSSHQSFNRRGCRENPCSGMSQFGLCLLCATYGLMLLFICRVHTGRRLQEALTMPFILSPSNSDGIMECSGKFTALSTWAAVIPCLLSPLLLSWCPSKAFSFSFQLSKCDCAIILLCTEVTSDFCGLCSPLFPGLTGYMEPTCPHEHLNQVP